MKGREFFVAHKRRPRLGGLILPTSSRLHGRPVVDRCVVPVDREGEIVPCGHPRFEGESMESFERGHQIDCLRRNHETIVAVREQQHPAIMDPWDPELAKWVQRHGEAILEGRKRI